jgi:anti-anti-sigma factor
MPDESFVKVHADQGSSGPVRLEVESVLTGARNTLVLSGELDLASAWALTESVERLAAEGPRALSIDLGGLTFMDSTGLRAVLLARAACIDSGQDFSLKPGPPAVQRIFELTGLIAELGFEDPESGAPADHPARSA